MKGYGYNAYRLDDLRETGEEALEGSADEGRTGRAGCRVHGARRHLGPVEPAALHHRSTPDPAHHPGGEIGLFQGGSSVLDRRSRLRHARGRQKMDHGPSRHAC